MDNIKPTGYVQNASHIGMAQNIAKDSLDSKEIQQKGETAGINTGALGRMGIKEEKAETEIAPEAMEVYVPTATEDAEQLAFAHTKEESADSSSIPENVLPDTHADNEKQYAQYKDLSKSNKQMLDNVYSGKLPLNQVPELPLNEAEGTLKGMVDFALSDQGGNKAMPFWKKWMMKSPRKIMTDYDKFAGMATDRQMAGNPKLDRDRLYLYNMSQVILNDKDQFTGKPRMENMAASAFQYKNAYEKEATSRSQESNPASRFSKDIDAMLTNLPPEQMGAVLAKENELKDKVLAMAAQGKPISMEDIQTLRASNLVELARSGQVSPEIAAKARDFLMNAESNNGAAGAQGDILNAGAMNYGVAGFPPGVNPGIPDLPGPVSPGTFPQTGMPGGQVMPGGIVPNQNNQFLMMLMMQERASKMRTAMMLMMCGPAVMPYALMLMSMPSSLPYLASLFSMKEGGMPNQQMMQPPVFPGMPGSIPGMNQQAYNPYAAAAQAAKTPPLLEKEDKPQSGDGLSAGKNAANITKPSVDSLLGKLEQAGGEMGAAMSDFKPEEKKGLKELKDKVDTWATEQEKQGKVVDRSSMFALALMNFSKDQIQKNPDDKELSNRMEKAFSAAKDLIETSHALVENEKKQG